MKLTNRRPLLKVASVISSVAFLVAGGLCQRPANCDPLVSDALSIQMSLLSGSRLSFGEPIVLQYKLTNISDQVATAYVGPDVPGPAQMSGEMRWLRIKLSDAQGSVVPVMPSLNAAQHNGLQFTGCSVQAGQSQQGYIVLSKSYMIPHPGDFSLVVLAQLPLDIEVGKPAENAPGQEVPFETPPAYLATQRFSFALHVTPADPKKLRGLAGTLRREATGEFDVAKATMLIESLFSLPEEQAWPEWQTIATDPTLFPSTQLGVIKQLRRLNTLKATDILARALWAAPSSKNMAAQASRNEALHSMYLGGNPKIKQHIRSLYIAHGVSETRLLESATASHPNRTSSRPN